MYIYDIELPWTRSYSRNKYKEKKPVSRLSPLPFIVNHHRLQLFSKTDINNAPTSRRKLHNFSSTIRNFEIAELSYANIIPLNNFYTALSQEY